jgi:hypothetical protein
VTAALDELHAVLDELGRLGDADAVAYHLLGQGVSGTRREAYVCPVAAYVSRRLNVPDVWAYPDTIALCDGDDYEDTTAVPDVIKVFMRRFDEGAYPFLDDELAATDEERGEQSAHDADR